MNKKEKKERPDRRDTPDPLNNPAKKRETVRVYSWFQRADELAGNEPEIATRRGARVIIGYKGRRMRGLEKGTDAVCSTDAPPVLHLARLNARAFRSPPLKTAIPLADRITGAAISSFQFPPTPV
jgi:hypothetical protein